jgi:hypothetical protein
MLQNSHCRPLLVQFCKIVDSIPNVNRLASMYVCVVLHTHTTNQVCIEYWLISDLYGYRLVWHAHNQMSAGMCLSIY